MPLILDGTKGETFPSWTTATRPATPNAGQTGYNTTLGGLETYNGSAWVTPDFGPSFYAYSTAPQTISTFTTTKIAFNSIASPGFDTGSFFNTSTNRFAPTVAGYYLVVCNVYVTASTSLVYNQIQFYKGASVYTSTLSPPYAGTSSIANASAIIYLNGNTSTDYVEAYCTLNGTGTLQIYGDASSGKNLTFFMGSLLRAA